MWGSGVQVTHAAPVLVPPFPNYGTGAEFEKVLTPMTSFSGEINIWLYTSRFHKHLPVEGVKSLAQGFAKNNRHHEIAGFMISDAKSVMQYIEGPKDRIKELKNNILADDRHHTIKTEIRESVTQRAYPDWSMKALQLSDYENLFENIDSALSENLAVKTSRIIFDVTFDC